MVAVSLLVLLIVTITIKSKIRSRVKKACEDGGGTWDKKNKACKAPVVVVDNSGGGSGSTDPADYSQFNPDYLSKEIFQNIEGINGFFYEETAEKILQLTDKDLRILYNYYNKNYAKEYPTLTKLFASEWDGYWFSISPYDRVVNRLKAIGLN